MRIIVINVLLKKILISVDASFDYFHNENVALRRFGFSLGCQVSIDPLRGHIRVNLIPEMYSRSRVGGTHVIAKPKSRIPPLFLEFPASFSVHYDLRMSH
jgi:hypothetical protein